MKGPYDDIINLPHHVSKTRPRMSQSNRAAQFSPFAALTGYDAAIKETGRLTTERIELEDDAKEILNRKNAYLSERLDEQPLITITYFLPDEKKTGGAYLTVTERIKKLNPNERTISLADGTKIPFDDVINIESDLFVDMTF